MAATISPTGNMKAGWPTGAKSLWASGDRLSIIFQPHDCPPEMEDFFDTMGIMAG